jgi:hypothetical protein
MRHQAARQRVAVIIGILVLATGLAARVQAQGPGKAIATAEAETPGVRVEVQELKRDEGGTVTVRFQMINDSDKAFGGGCEFRETGSEHCGKISGVHLLDPANKKKYLVVRDSKRECVCAAVDRLKPGERRNLWAKFPAPPDTVQKVSVIVPKFQPMDGVPISR